MNNETNKSHWSFWIIGVVALIWNLFGCFQFFVEYNFWKNPEARSALGEMEEVYSLIYDATPGWLYVVFAIAVVAGAIASIGLLMRKGWAVTLFALSLIAIVIQMGYNLLGTDYVERLGASSVIMPLVVIALALFLWYYAKNARTQGRIT